MEIIVAVVVFVLIISMIKGAQTHQISNETPSGFEQINPMPSNLQLNKFLDEHFPFYKQLGPHNRQRFLVRMRTTLSEKYFLGKEGLVVHPVMIILICATLVQITFGLRQYQLPHFTRFVIFPDIFYSRLFDRNVKGLTVYHSGMIAISWPHALEGHKIADDKINLLIHELAHALYLDYFGNRSERFGFSSWKDVALPIFEQMNAIGNHPFLREYAASNIDEFWAVCVEHFFEAPEAFSIHLPELYESMRSILRIDPRKLNARKVEVSH